MSKLSQLKQDAYQAGKKRNWDEAVALYERILEVDKNNPTVINELGDLCLKAGKTVMAVRHFLSAASKYRTTGLLNNAVAIYKKILRYEAGNLNAHWYLAETRANQALLVEGEIHALHFLEGSDSVAGDLKEIFLKRCVQLLELYPESEPITGRLVHIFRTWQMKLESVRAALLHAGQVWDAGGEDEARAEVESLLADCPEARNYPEFTRWQRRAEPDAVARGGAFTDFGDVDLGDAPAAPAPAQEAASAAQPAATTLEEPEAAPAVTAPPQQQGDHAPADEDGCIAIDDDSDPEFAELIAAAAGKRDDAGDTAEADATPAAAAPAEPAEAGGGVDLLAEILADDDAGLLAGAETSQLESITREIGAQVGGGGEEQEPESLFNAGTVYLEMGFHDQACEAFATVVESGDATFGLRAREMWGEALQRTGDPDAAIEVMREGLDGMSTADAAYPGLLYNLGKACEAAGRRDEAVAAYEKIRAAVGDYLDVARRLDDLAAV